MKTKLIYLAFILISFNINAQTFTKKGVYPKISTQSIFNNGKITNKVLSAESNIILYNANVITMDDRMPNAQAIALKSNVISAVGSNDYILSFQDENTQLFDLQGRTVVPGLIEVHGHRLLNAYRGNGPEGLIQATQDMAADGYTTAHELYGDSGFISCAQTLSQNKELSVRINCYVPYNTNCNENVIPWKTYSYTEKVDTTLRIVGVKIFADGGSCGYSALTTLYQAGPAADTYGDIFRTQDEMNEIVNTILEAGYPIAMHAIGDSAIGVGLNAFEKAFSGTGNTLRSRMEHLRVMRKELVHQMDSLGIVASIQYTWANAQSAERWDRYFLPEVLEWCYPWRRLADEGIPIIGGNDDPYCLRTQAMQTISILATRKTAANDTLADWMDGDQLTVEEGLRAMAVTNAWVAFEEELKGSITPGKLADLTILSDDPLIMDPFDVRNITIEMTIMDGIIRHNQIGITHTAVHDAGLFNVGIDDRGLWGATRSGVGLLMNGLEYLFMGSLLISYDDNTVATANSAQKDYVTSENGSIDFIEPGILADEEATAIYEDGAVWHQDKIRITQQTFMWQGEPLILIKYALENISENPLSNIYLGQVMDIDIGYFADNMGGWELNDGLGFAYMHNVMSSNHPYIGIAMFNASGNYANTGLSFTSPAYFDNNGEQLMAEIMRNEIIDSETSEASDYSILLSHGPVNFDISQSKSPFIIAIVVGENLEELKNAVNQAYERFNSLTQIIVRQNEVPDKFTLYQNFPNPFNPATIIKYNISAAELRTVARQHVTLKIFDILGRQIETIVNEQQKPGYYEVEWSAIGKVNNLSSGVYFYHLKAGNPSTNSGQGFAETKKMILLR